MVSGCWIDINAAHQSTASAYAWKRFFPPHCLLKWTSQSPAQRKRESVIAPFQASSRFHLNTLNLHMTHLDSTHLVPSQTVPLVSVGGVFEISSSPDHFMRSVYCSSTPGLDLADFPPPVCVCFLFFKSVPLLLFVDAPLFVASSLFVHTLDLDCLLITFQQHCEK